MSSLYDLNEFIRRVLALNFQQPIWIAAEIAQVSQSRGHFYLDLVEKGPDNDLIAQASATLWSNDYRRLRQVYGPDADAVLRDGMAVKICVRVDFHERYGLKLQIVDLDPAHTFGALELRRRQVIQILQQAGLLERNRTRPLPAVLQRIAIISSEGAAGFQDFREQLTANAFGYQFDCEFFNAAVQGQRAEEELQVALAKVAARSMYFDCVVIIRGGGARLDLAAFDGLELCRAVALCPVPVLSGIGHDIDSTVLDLVAHTALKTPTAVADFILQHNLFFENYLLELAGQIRLLGDFHLKAGHLQVARVEQALHFATRQRIRSATSNLDATAEKLPLLTRQILRNTSAALERVELFCSALQPENVLRRGYSLTLHNGKVLTDAQQVQRGDIIETRLQRGVLKSKIE